MRLSERLRSARLPVEHLHLDQLPLEKLHLDQLPLEKLHLDHLREVPQQLAGHLPDDLPRRLRRGVRQAMPAARRIRRRRRAAMFVVIGAVGVLGAMAIAAALRRASQRIDRPLDDAAATVAADDAPVAPTPSDEHVADAEPTEVATSSTADEHFAPLLDA